MSREYELMQTWQTWCATCGEVGEYAYEEFAVRAGVIHQTRALELLDGDHDIEVLAPLIEHEHEDEYAAYVARTQADELAERREFEIRRRTFNTCPRCARTSHNPSDIREGYCGACHDWTSQHDDTPNQ